MINLLTKENEIETLLKKRLTFLLNLAHAEKEHNLERFLKNVQNISQSLKQEVTEIFILIEHFQSHFTDTKINEINIGRMFHDFEKVLQSLESNKRLIETNYIQTITELDNIKEIDYDKVKYELHKLREKMNVFMLEKTTIQEFNKYVFTHKDSIILNLKEEIKNKKRDSNFPLVFLPFTLLGILLIPNVAGFTSFIAIITSLVMKGRDKKTIREITNIQKAINTYTELQMIPSVFTRTQK